MKKQKRYANGGDLFMGSTNLLSSVIDANNVDEYGQIDKFGTTASSAIRGAGTGFGIGNAIAPGIGGLIGGGAGLLIGAIAGNKQAKKLQREANLAKRQARVMNAQLQQDQVDSYLQSYHTEGVQSNTYFAAKGGKLKSSVKGSNLFDIAPGVKKVRGKKHEEGGENVTDIAGNVIGNVEDQEVLKGAKVFSNRIKIPGSRHTFANAAEIVARTPQYAKNAKRQARHLDRLQDPKLNSYQLGTAMRSLSTLVNPLDRLFNMQEAYKVSNNMGNKPRKYANGGDIFNAFANVMPYADNVVNAIITKRSPQVPKPTLLKAPKLKTRFDINPQLAAIDRNASARDANIMRNTSQAGTLRSNLIAGDIQDIQARNDLYGQRANIETELANKQSMLNYENTARNAGAVDQYNINKMQRMDDVQNRTSANVANLVEDVRLGQRNRNLEMRDKQALALTALKYLDTGVLNRSGYAEILRRIEAGEDVSEALKALERPANFSQIQGARGGTKNFALPQRTPPLFSVNPTFQYANPTIPTDIGSLFKPWNRK